MILKKKKPIKAFFGLATAAVGAAAGAAKKGIQAGIQKGMQNAAQKPYMQKLTYDMNAGDIGLDNLSNTAYNKNTLGQLQGLYEDSLPDKGDPVKRKRTAKLFDEYRGDAFEKDQYGNLTANPDFLNDFYYRMYKNQGFNKRRSKDMASSSFDDFQEDYSNQFSNSQMEHLRNQDLVSTQGLMARSGTKLLPKKRCSGGKAKCGGKLQKGAKVPKSISKVEVDRKGPVKSISKTTATGSGEGLKKKLGKFGSPGKPSKTLIRRDGGKLEELDGVNVVVKGKLHKENNNLGNKDKGVPVITPEGEKAYEVEKQEIIFRKSLTDLVEKSKQLYKDSKDDALLTKVGEIVAKELLTNTQDNDGRFGVKVLE